MHVFERPKRSNELVAMMGKSARKIEQSCWNALSREYAIEIKSAEHSNSCYHNASGHAVETYHASCLPL